MENLITSSRSIGINYMGLNELMNMIYNFMTLENILNLIFVFQKNIFSYAMTYKLIKYVFVNKDETFIFSLYLILPEFGFSSWLSCGLDGLLQLDYNCYTNHCFNLFFVSKLFMICVSLLHYDFVNVTNYITYILSIL